MQRILLVDDERLSLYSLSRALANEGAEVTTVMCGTDALDALRRKGFDLCFLDIQLPDANGLELMRDIRNLSPATRIVIMTADTLTDEQHRMITSMGCLYLPKPFEAASAQALAQSPWGCSPAGA